MGTQERVSKILSACGVCSRRAAEALFAGSSIYPEPVAAEKALAVRSTAGTKRCRTDRSRRAAEAFPYARFRADFFAPRPLLVDI